MLLTIPPTLAYAFVCLAAWYPVRAMPLRARAHRAAPRHARVRGGGAERVVGDGVHALGAHARRDRSSVERIAALFVTGALLYLLSVAFHYLLAGLERELAKCRCSRATRS